MQRNRILQKSPRRFAYQLVGRNTIVISMLCCFLGGNLTAGQEAAGGEPAGKAPISPLELTGEAREWARSVALRGSGSDRRRLERILRAMLDPHRLALQESDQSTPTAMQAFRTKRANCVGFAFLFVAVAREAGIPAFFAAVEGGRRRNPEGGFRLVEEHLTAAARVGHQVWLFDFGGSQQGNKVAFRSLGDLAAIAIYYSNRGVEELLAGSPEKAVEALETAVHLEPNLADSWVNLGVARRWVQRWDGAERAYRKALELSPASSVAAGNLAVLLELDGRSDEATKLRKRTGQMSQSDPFALLKQAELSLTAGRLEEARRLYARALEISAR